MKDVEERAKAVVKGRAVSRVSSSRRRLISLAKQAMPIVTVVVAVDIVVDVVVVAGDDVEDTGLPG